RQFFRIVEMAFGVRFPSEATPDLDRVPRTALPPRALVVLFSPLLDRRALNAVTDLRQRGVSLVIVDVLTHEPPADRRLPMTQLSVPLSPLDRGARRARGPPPRPGSPGAARGQGTRPGGGAGTAARAPRPGGPVMSAGQRPARAGALLRADTPLRPGLLLRASVLLRAGVLLRAATGCLGAGMIILPAPTLPNHGWVLILARPP